MTHLSETAKGIMDALAVVLSVGAGIATWVLTVLPVIMSIAASAVSLAWGCIRIHEWYKAKKEGKNGNVRLD